MKLTPYLELALAILVCSCSDNISTESSEDMPSPSQAISFTVPTRSRGAEIEAVTEFAVSCSVDKNDATSEFLYFAQEEFTGSGTSFSCSSGNEYYWLDDSYDYQFYAYAPLSTEGRVFIDSKYSVFNYSPPANAAEQVDLLAYYASTKKTQTEDPTAFFETAVSLPFRHILSQICLTQGRDMASGSIFSISLSGLHGTGQYDIATDSWSITDKAESTFTLNLTNNGAGSSTSSSGSLTGETGNFFLLPQSVDNMVISIVYAGTDGERKTHTKSLTINWEKGKKYTLALTINPEAEIVISEDELLQDAHYVLMKDEAAITLNLKNLPSGRTVMLKAAADDGAVVTMQRESDLNVMAQQGYWTDFFYANGSPTQESARGSRDGTLSGLSDGDRIAVFLPENSGMTDREITFSLSLDGSTTVLDSKTITQLCPAWTSSDFGWEQKRDDNQGAYGFSWDRLISYQLVYSSNSGFGQDREAYCNSVIEENKTWTNDNFAKTQRFWYRLASYRYCITLNYSVLNADVATSRSNGLENTITLNRNAGGAATAAFETVLQNIKKTESGKETENAFRQMTASDIYNGKTANYGPSGKNVTGSDAIAQILKKNRYYIQEIVKSEGSNNITSYSPVLLEEDIVWFLPAVDQFSFVPDCTAYPHCDELDVTSWSSTGISGSSYSYIGDGNQKSRSLIYPVRATRLKPNP